MTASTVYKKSFDAFKKATIELKPSEVFNAYRGSDKPVLAGLGSLDKAAGSTTDAMNTALGNFENVTKTYLDKLIVQAGKEKLNGPKLKTEIMKMRMAVMAIVNDYKKDIVKLAASEDKLKEKGVEEVKKKGSVVANEAAQKANDKKFAKAVELLHTSRKKERDSQKELNTEMGGALQRIENLREDAKKVLLQAESKAGSEGGAELAIKSSQLIAKMASDAEKLAKQSSLKRDKQQKEFMEFRDGLNWKTMAKKFDLSESEYDKRYSVELKKCEPLYSEAIKLGSQSIMICSSMTQLADDVSSMVDICKGYAMSANEALKLVLNDLRNGTGKTNRAAFDTALSGDPKKSFFHLVHKIRESDERLHSVIKNWVENQKNKNVVEMEKHASSCHMLWDGIDSSIADARSAYARAELAQKNAKERVPSRLSANKDIKQALEEMGSVMVKAKRELDSVEEDIFKSQTVLKNLGLL